MTMLTSLMVALILALGPEEPLPQNATSNPTLETVLSNVKKASENIEDLRAEFVQENIFTVFDEKEKSAGQVFYRRPDLLIMRQEKPEEVTTWMKGREIMVYEKEVDQLRKYALSEEDRDLSFLAARFDGRVLEKRFSLCLKRTLRKRNERLFVVELIPKSEELAADIDRVEVEISDERWLVKRISIYETNRDITRITFSNIRLNTGLRGSEDLPKMPEGKQVIDLSE